MASKPRRTGGKRPARPAKSVKRPSKSKSRPAPKHAPAKVPTKKGTPPPRAETPPPLTLPRPTGDERLHVLSLSFLRDGDEFMARMETDGGQITELKNRSLDQLLTLVANELEDLLE